MFIVIGSADQEKEYCDVAHMSANEVVKTESTENVPSHITRCVREHAVSTWLESSRVIRLDALKSSNRASARMVARRFGMRQPTTYLVGDDVLVRTVGMQVGKRAKRNFRRLKCYPGTVIEINESKFRYKVSYETSDGEKEGWFSVNDITSGCRRDEIRRNEDAYRRGNNCICMTHFLY